MRDHADTKRCAERTKTPPPAKRPRKVQRQNHTVGARETHVGADARARGHHIRRSLFGAVPRCSGARASDVAGLARVADSLDLRQSAPASARAALVGTGRARSSDRMAAGHSGCAIRRASSPVHAGQRRHPVRLAVDHRDDPLRIAERFSRCNAASGVRPQGASRTRRNRQASCEPLRSGREARRLRYRHVRRTPRR